MGGEILGGGGFEVDLTGTEHSGAGGAIEVDFAVTGQADDDDLAGAVGVGDGADDVLQGVCGGPFAIGTRVRCVRSGHESLDGRGIGGVFDMRGGRLRVGNRLGHDRGHGLDVRGVSARGLHEGVLADLGGVDELFGSGAAHGARGRLDRQARQPEACEGTQVGHAHGFVGGVESGVVDVEGVGVLHDEFAAAQQTGAGAGLVAVLRLDLVDRQRQVFVRGVEVLDQEGEDLLMGGSEDVVVLAAVLEMEEGGGEGLPAAGLLVRIGGQQTGEVDFLGTGERHLFAHDGLDLAEHGQAQRQPRVDSRC